MCTGGYITYITSCTLNTLNTLNTAPYKPVVLTMMALQTDDQARLLTELRSLLTMCLEDFIFHLASPILTIIQS